MERNVIISDAIRYQPHLYAFDIWMQQWFRRVDLGQLLIYFIDKVNAQALGYLAQEMDMLGNKGWNFCADELAQRALLKMAVQFHRYAGTVWVIEQCLLLAGITSGVVAEGTGIVGDGNDWLRFEIINVDAIMVPTAKQISDATILINVYKRKSAIFMGFVHV